MTGRVWAVIPVKRFVAAKTRLSPVLDADERAELARLMFEDVIETVTACSDVLDGTLVITIDPEAAALARRRDAFVLGDVSERGVNDALSRGLRYLEATADGVIVVPSDIPQIARPALVESAAAIATGPAVALVCAADDGGTNLFASQTARRDQATIRTAQLRATPSCRAAGGRRPSQAAFARAVVGHRPS